MSASFHLQMGPSKAVTCTVAQQKWGIVQGSTHSVSSPAELPILIYKTQVMGVTKESGGCSQITRSKNRKAWLPENIRMLFQNRASILSKQSNRCPKHSPVTMTELNSLSLTLQPSTQGSLKSPFLLNRNLLCDSLLTVLSFHFYKVFPPSVSLLMSLPSSLLNFANPSNSRLVHLSSPDCNDYHASLHRSDRWCRQWLPSDYRHKQGLEKIEKVLTLLFTIKEIKTNYVFGKAEIS